MFKKIKLYGVRKSFRYGALEAKYLLRQKFLGSFSQTREDLEIDKILNCPKKGFYVDIGAYDPTRFSNTKRFYLRGWEGINIEPNPVRFQKFLKERPGDINLNLGIAETSSDMTLYLMYPETLSTFSHSEMKKRLAEGYKLLKETIVPLDTLENIFNKHAKNKNIDFFSIDTEGLDLVVLKSNNWKEFRPKVICLETSDTLQTRRRQKVSFLGKVGYRLVINNGLNSIFVESKEC